MPVSIPMSSQHVHEVLGDRVAGRARRVRAAAEPADRRVEARRRRARAPASDVRERGAAGVVEVQADRDRRSMPARVERVEQVVDPPGRRHAGGVAERQPVGARVEQVPGELRDPLGRDVALVGAAERRSTRSPRPAMPPVVRERDDLVRADRATRRPSGARSSGCGSRSRSPRARARRPWPRSPARRPWRSARAPSRRRPGRRSIRGHHLLGAGHRRDRGRRHERRGLDPAQPGAATARRSAGPARRPATGSSFCSPSRGPTSRISTVVREAGIRSRLPGAAPGSTPGHRSSRRTIRRRLTRRGGGPGS